MKDQPEDNCNRNDYYGDYYGYVKCKKDYWDETPILFHLNLEIIERINDDGVETEVVSVIIWVFASVKITSDDDDDDLDLSMRDLPGQGGEGEHILQRPGEENLWEAR